MPEKSDKYPYETATTEQKELGSYWWCIHHRKLIESLSESIEFRVHYIKHYKPFVERDCRLKNMVPVLRPDLLPKVWIEANQAYDEADRACRKANQAWNEADRAWIEANQAWNEADRAWIEANQAWEEADRACRKANQAWEEADQAQDKANRARDRASCGRDRASWTCKKELEAQHKLEYPNSTWSEGSIFDE